MRISDWSSDVCSADLISEHATRMLSLKARLQALRELVPLDRPVVYLDYPVHLNIGDLLINLGTEEWFGSAGYEIECRASVFDFGRSDAGKISHASSKIGRASCLESVCQ